MQRCIDTPRSLRATPATLDLDAGVDIIKAKDRFGQWNATIARIGDKRRRGRREGRRTTG